MGGYFALRGATDPRVKACVSSDDFYDFGVAVRARTPWFWRYLSDDVADFLLDLAARYHFQTRWEFGHCALFFSARSLSAGMHRLQRYTVTREVAGISALLDQVTRARHGRARLHLRSHRHGPDLQRANAASGRAD
ncbi:hypothetical protein DL768_006783 [Monosporascus sp. mg162]|nr:hypothetical protein DL768_006783 [Monosporascus sp. mg162]